MPKARTNRNANDLSENAAKNAKAKCTAWDFEIKRRIKRRKRIFEEQALDAGLTAEEEYIRSMISVINHLQHKILIGFLR